MSKEKQIEEMSQDLEDHTCMSEYQADIASRTLYILGYRKQSKGKWIWTENGEEDYEQYWVCSCCHEKSYIEEKYCPSCGARMKTRYTIQISRKGEDKWSIWTTADEYDEAAAHKRYCESVGYCARIIEDNGEE